MKSIFALLATFTLLLTGCALVVAQRQQAAVRQAETIQDECEQKRSSGYFKTRVETVQCGRERIRQILFLTGYPHLDLFDLRAVNDVVLARKVDSGELTRDEARLHSAEMHSRVATEEQRRITAAQQTQLQAQQMQQQKFQHSLNIYNNRTGLH